MKQIKFFWKVRVQLKLSINYKLSIYKLLKNVKWQVMFTKRYFEQSQTSTMELFSLQLNHILKMYLIQSIDFRFHFLHNLPFCEKAYNCENFSRKSLLLTREQFFFKI